MNKPHKHAELIKQWADGAQIQWQRTNKEWVDTSLPQWDSSMDTFRVKPQLIQRWAVEYLDGHISPLVYDSYDQAADRLFDAPNVIKRVICLREVE